MGCDTASDASRTCGGVPVLEEGWEGEGRGRWLREREGGGRAPDLLQLAEVEGLLLAAGADTSPRLGNASTCWGALDGIETSVTGLEVLIGAW